MKGGLRVDALDIFSITLILLKLTRYLEISWGSIGCLLGLYWAVGGFRRALEYLFHDSYQSIDSKEGNKKNDTSTK